MSSSTKKRRRGLEWVRIQALSNSYRLVCKRCGTESDFIPWMPLKEFAPVCMAFEGKHAGCNANPDLERTEGKAPPPGT